MILETELQEEAELVAAVLKKDRKATAEFVSRYGNAVHSYLARRLMPRQDLVEDLFQQVFLEGWQNLARFRGDSGVKSWLLGIARHKVQDHYRARLRELQIVDDEAPEPGDGVNLEEVMEKKGSREKVWQVMETLTEDARVLLLWRYWEGWSAEAMAEAACKTPKGVERALARAREQFKQKWYGDEMREAGKGNE